MLHINFIISFPVYPSFHLAIHPIRQIALFDRFYVISTSVVSFVHRLLVDSRGIIRFGLSCSWNKVIFRFSAVAQRVVQSKQTKTLLENQWLGSRSGFIATYFLPTNRTFWARVRYHFPCSYKTGKLLGRYLQQLAFVPATNNEKKRFKERFRIRKHVHIQLYAIFILILVLFVLSSWIDLTIDRN